MARDITARQRIVSYLAHSGPVVDDSGRAASALKEAVGYPSSQLGFTQLLAAMERDGQIRRDIRGKRTYKVWTELDAAAVVPFADDRVAGVVAEDDLGRDDGFDYDELANALLRRVARTALLERDGAAAVSSATQRRIRRLEARISELEREVARAQAERDRVIGERDELGRQLEAAVNNVEVLTERLAGAAPRSHNRARDRLDSEERAILDQLTGRPRVVGRSA